MSYVSVAVVPRIAKQENAFKNQVICHFYMQINTPPMVDDSIIGGVLLETMELA